MILLFGVKGRSRWGGVPANCSFAGLPRGAYGSAAVRSCLHGFRPCYHDVYHDVACVFGRYVVNLSRTKR